MSQKTPPSVPPLNQRLKKIITSSEKRNEAIRWRVKAASTQIRNFLKNKDIQATKRKDRETSQKNTTLLLEKSEQIRTEKRKNRRTSQENTIVLLKNRRSSQETVISQLREQLEQQKLASAAYNTNIQGTLSTQIKTLQGRLKTITNDFNKQRVEANEAKKALNAITYLVKGDALEQLKVTNSLLKTKSVNLASMEKRISNVEAYVDHLNSDKPTEFSIENFVTKALANGYHEQGRYFLLDELLQHDWEALLAFFTATNNGFDALEKLRPLFAPWIENYHALIDVIEDRGFQIRPIDDYIDNGMQDKTVYIYHDVHAWDIIPALGMVLANKDRGICTTFCLNIDQAHVDIAHEAGYRIFGTLYGDNAKLGLHCNPFASWVRMDVFNEDEKAFTDWYHSDTSAEQLKAMLAGNPKESGIFEDYTCKTAETETFARLDKNFQKLKSFCPEARVANHHGDVVNNLCKSTRSKKKKIHSFLFVATMLREGKAKRLGVLTSPTAIRRQNNPVGTIYGEFENRDKYFENLHAELGNGISKQLINHPGAISNSGLIMNLDFVRELGTGSFEQYPPMGAKKSTQKTPLSATIVQIDEDD